MSSEQFAIDIAKALVPTVIKAWAARRSNASTTKDVDVNKALALYLERVIPSYCFTKTLALKDVPLPIAELYEPLNLMFQKVTDQKLQQVTLENVSVADLSHVSKPLLISATAGAGKSTLMRWLFYNALETGQNVPILLELRKFSESKLGLLKHIEQAVWPDESKSSERVSELLRGGNLLILLDGFDEVEEAQRPVLINEILSAMDSYPRNLWVLSSRPDPKLEALSSFTVLRPCALTLNQSLSLIKRIPFDEEAKSGFLEYLGGKKHPQFESFVSNPLLLTIMFVTFVYCGSIQYQKSAFYHDAFHAMYSRHDATKYGFERKFTSGIDRPTLETLVESFCIQTFLQQKRSFDESTALSLISKVLKTERLKAKPQHILQDLLQTVCLLVRDGRLITYSHRSFEEYFAALFISKLEANRKAVFLTEVTRRSVRDNVCVQVLHELDPFTIERTILIRAVEKLVRPSHTALEMFTEILRGVRLEQLGASGWRNKELKEELGSYRSYLGYVLRELDVLFPDLPRANTPINVQLDKFRKITTDEQGRLLRFSDLHTLLVEAEPWLHGAAEAVAGVTFQQVVWLHSILGQMHARTENREAFLDELVTNARARSTRKVPRSNLGEMVTATDDDF